MMDRMGGGSAGVTVRANLTAAATAAACGAARAEHGKATSFQGVMHRVGSVASSPRGPAEHRVTLRRLQRVIVPQAACPAPPTSSAAAADGTAMLLH